MSESTGIDQLLELARNARETAARNFGESRQREEQAQAKRELLESYWSEYQAKRRSIYRADATLLANFHGFSEKLKAAIERQELELAGVRRNTEAARRELDLASQRLRSLELLAERRAATARASAHRLQQKQQDEVTLRRHFHGVYPAG